MRSADEALAVAERALRFVRGADQAQVTVSFESSAYARFARNYVTQNLDRDETEVAITYVKDKRLGNAVTGSTTADGLRALAQAAADIAERVPANHEFVSLAKSEPIAPAVRSHFDSTANASADDRVGKLVPVFERMRRSNLNASGFTTTGRGARAVANTLGVRARFEGTRGGIEIKALAAQTSGFAEFFARDYAALDSAERAERAASKATVSQTPEDFAPGVYSAILEPPAFFDCLNVILERANAEDVLETKESWMTGRIGKALLSANLTIVDDWSHPLLANAPFADDGAPTRKVTLIERGVPQGYVSSTYLANKFKIANTGHSENYPINAVVLPGTKTREQLIASVERGVLISRTWYTRTVDPREAVITGLTRDGVFLIEDGRLTRTLKNFRFYLSMLTALRDVELGNRLYLAEAAGDAPGTIAVPDVKIGRFALSAQTSFA